MTMKLYPYFKRAYHGKRVWNRIKKKYQFDDSTQLVIMPEDDEELNGIAFHYMPYMMKKRGAKNAIVVRPKGREEEAQATNDSYDARYLYLRQGEIEDLLHYYELYVFTGNISIISLAKPEGNDLHKLIGKNGINEADAVCLGMYALREIPKNGEQP